MRPLLVSCTYKPFIRLLSRIIMASQLQTNQPIVLLMYNAIKGAKHPLMHITSM